MTFDEKTLECTCSRCNYQWRARTATRPPVKCPACTSLNWNEAPKRKLTSIIARVCGWDENKEKLKLSILDYVDNPQVITDDICYLSAREVEKYLFQQRYPEGSALIFIGSFEILEDLELRIIEMKLIYGHAVGFNQYLSSANCLYNIKSFYERQKAQKRRDAEAELKAILEEERKEKLIEEARLQLQAEEERKTALEAAKQKLADKTATTDEKLEAIADIRRL